jgi:LysM repeat protein
MATVRLTRRGRIVLVFTVMMLAVIAGLTVGHGSSLAAARSHQTRHTLIVEPGETLWSVAARIAPHQDPRLVVANLESLNHLSSPAIEAGEQLVIPPASS